MCLKLKKVGCHCKYCFLENTRIPQFTVFTFWHVDFSKIACCMVVLIAQAKWLRSWYFSALHNCSILLCRCPLTCVIRQRIITFSSSLIQHFSGNCRLRKSILFSTASGSTELMKAVNKLTSLFLREVITVCTTFLFITCIRKRNYLTIRFIHLMKHPRLGSRAE